MKQMDDNEAALFFYCYVKMPKYFIKSFAERINQESALDVKEAEDGEPVFPSKVIVAPAEFEMHLIKSKQKNGVFIQLKKEKNRMHYLSPSVVYGMPAAAIDAGVIDNIVPFDKIPSVLLEMVERTCGN